MMRANALVLTIVLTMISMLNNGNVSAAEEHLLLDHHSPSPSPSHHHHHHYHHHSPPSYPPVHPPTKSPNHPPTRPPVKPVKPPTKSPAHPPVKPPAHSPVKPPSHPPVKPPTPSPFPRKYVVVQGVVYCKFCKFKGISTLTKASPLSGAEVKLECNNTKYPLRAKGKTDKNGYFRINAPKSITSYGARSCRVTLLSSPNKQCNSATDLHAGITGSILNVDWKSVSNTLLPYVLYNVGPFAYEPAKNIKCY